MGADTAIEWAHHTFNPWTGCTKVSPGCDHCYAESWAKRSGMVEWGDHPRRRTSAANWRQPLKWNAAALTAGTRARVFCASLADVFDNQAPDEWRADLARLIEATPALDWLLLTKRIGNAEKMLRAMFPGGVPSNVWLGATVVNQEEAHRDVPKLLFVKNKLRITVTFLSMEPLLGPVDLKSITLRSHGPRDELSSTLGDWISPLRGAFIDSPTLDWIIVGGESGPKARPMHPDWARSLRDQCAAAGVPFLFKQWGEWAPVLMVDDGAGNESPAYPLQGCSDPHAHRASQECLFYQSGRGGGEAEWVHWPMVSTLPAIGARRVGKKPAGRLLDGVEHNGFPEARDG